MAGENYIEYQEIELQKDAVLRSCSETMWIRKLLAGFWQLVILTLDFTIEQWFSTRGQFSPIPHTMGHVVVSRDTLSCWKWRSVTGIW